ncbi:MAG TPA: acyl carrier protein [Gemmatimonadaceae bacterium]|nr:acyl carrier protein [Gemmatimonadaceae bacterium]
MAPEAVVARVLGLSRQAVTDGTSNTTESAWDSLNHVTLVLELESAYGVSLSAEDALAMTDVASIKRVLRDYGVEWDGA